MQIVSRASIQISRVVLDAKVEGHSGQIDYLENNDMNFQLLIS